MAYLDELTTRVRSGEPLPLLWDLLLRAATPATRLGMLWRLRQPVDRVDATVVSYGNITAGGTGKTPRSLRAYKKPRPRDTVAVVTRGYGSASVPEPFVVPTDMPRHEVARLAGDEPALIRHHVPECVVVKAAWRVDGARVAIKEHGCDYIVLDDAFQHVQLARDRNVCLIDASNPFGNGHLVPRGILREPLSALHRATHLELTRCDQAPDLDALLGRLLELAPGIPVRQTIHAPAGFWRVADGAPVAREEVRDQPVTAVSAIGHPDAFHRTLRGLGLTLKDTLEFRDHAPIPGDALQQDGLIITTEKDAMRMGAVPENVIALEIALRDFERSAQAGG